MDGTNKVCNYCLARCKQFAQATMVNCLKFKACPEAKISEKGVIKLRKT